MANGLGELEFITMSPSSAINGDGALDFDMDGLEGGETYDPISEVPEPAGVRVAALVAAVALCRRRAR